MAVLAGFWLLFAQAGNAAELRDHCHQPRPPKAITANTLRVMTLNVAHGRGTARNQFLVGTSGIYQNLDAVARLIKSKSTHVVALQEADAPSRWSGQFDQVSYVAEQTGLACSTHGVHSDSWMASYGTALVADAVLEFSDSRTFGPSWPTTRKGFVVARLNWKKNEQTRGVTIVSAHLDFLRARVRDRQIDSMIRNLSVRPGPFVIMGDVNSTWSDASGHVRRLSEELGLRVFEPDNENLGTYRSRSGPRLDWVLLSEELAFVDYQVLPDIVSDHLAVYAEIDYIDEDNQ